MGFPDAVNEDQRVVEAWRDRDGPVDARAAFFESFKDQRLAAEVYASHGQRQRLQDARAGEVQDLAERASIALGPLSCNEKRRTLGRGQIQPVAGRVDQIG